MSCKILYVTRKGFGVSQKFTYKLLGFISGECAFILIEDALVIIIVPLRDVSIINVFSVYIGTITERGFNYSCAEKAGVVLYFTDPETTLAGFAMAVLVGPNVRRCCSTSGGDGSSLS